MNTTPLSTMESPSVLIDEEILRTNIQWAQQTANARGLALRPHIKTHKCLEIARLQLAAGAVGITVSKTEEALVFITNGFPSVTVAYPVIDPAKLDRLLDAANNHKTDLRLIADSEIGTAAITAAVQRHDVPAKVFLKIDVGLHRCGVREDDPRLIPLARSLGSRFAGLLSHAGHAYGANNPAEVRAVAAEECAILQRVRRQLESAGIPVPEVSVGSTPTVLAGDAYDGITEIRPGNYVFMDLNPLRLGLIGPERIALSVLATVVSANRDYYIIDAGSKVLSSDAGAHGTTGVTGFGLAYRLEDYAEKRGPLSVVKLSEEHGFVQRGPVDLPVGSRVRITPNHSCPVANLARELVILRKGELPVRWPVAARACVK